MSIDKTARALMDALKQKEQPKPFDTTATVTRVEGDIAWVHIPGGVDETPVKMTIAASEGDEVQVRVAGGSAWLTGNASAPPTDDTTAEKALDEIMKLDKLKVAYADIGELIAKWIKTGKITSNDDDYFNPSQLEIEGGSFVSRFYDDMDFCTYAVVVGAMAGDNGIKIYHKDGESLDTGYVSEADGYVLDVNMRNDSFTFYQNGEEISLTSQKIDSWDSIGRNSSRSTSSAVSVASGSVTNLCSRSIPAGTYILTGWAAFDENATGVRSLSIHTTASAISQVAGRSINMPAVSGYPTRMSFSTPPITFNSTTTMYLNAWQNSGSARSVDGSLSYVRIR